MSDKKNLISRFLESFNTPKHVTESGASSNFAGGFVANKLGVTAFKYGSAQNKDKRPQDLMREAMDAYESRPLVTSGVNQLALLITGGSIKAKGSISADADKLQKWIDLRPGLPNEIVQMATFFLVTGNVPVELKFLMKSEKFYIDDIKCFYDPSIFYLTFAAQYENGQWVDADNEYYAIEVSRAIKGITIEGKVFTPKMYRIAYSPYAIAPQNMIYAVPFNKEKFKYLQAPYRKWGYYSESFVMAALDDVEAIYNIIQNIINITKYKAIGKKIISVGDKDAPATPQDIDSVKEQLESDQFSNVLINKKIEQVSLSYNGEYNTLSGEMDWLRREVTSGLSPNYLTPWGGQETNRASSAEVKIVLQMQLDIWKRTMLTFLNAEILPSIKEQFGITSDAEFDFPAVDLYTPDEKQRIANDMYDKNLMTANEYRLMMGQTVIEGGDKFKVQFDAALAPQKPQGDTSGFTMPVQPANNQAAYAEAIQYKREVLGHIIQVKQGAVNQVLDGKEVILETDDLPTAVTYYNSYINRLKSKEDLLPYELAEEEAQLNKILDKEFSIAEDKVTALITEHTQTESFKEGKFLDLKILNPLNHIMDNMFNGIQNNVAAIIAQVFNKSLADVKANLAKSNTLKQYDNSDANYTSMQIGLVKDVFDNDLKLLKDKKVNDMSRNVADAYVLNVPPAKIKKDLMDNMDKTRWEADRIIRTNLNKVANMTKLKLMDDMGVKSYEWIATIDDRTRATHLARHHQVYDVKRGLSGSDPVPTLVRDKSGQLDASECINCRCCIVPHYN